MKLLFIGDIVGSTGCAFAEKAVRKLKQSEKIDIVAVNGENSAEGNGINSSSYAELSRFADVITTGNHAFRRREFYDCYDQYDRLLRPANYAEGVAGKGIVTLDMGSYSFTIVNLMGTAFMQPLENPFHCMERLLKTIPTRNILVDIHAEATSEKKAMGFFLDGKVSAVIGTHTHVQTADEAILPNKTAYITDVGMCGASLSVLGVKPEQAIHKQMYNIPVTFETAGGDMEMGAVMIEINEKTGRAVSIRRILIKEKEV
ncbi:MAG: TIGR00282 family metallophosphoesterase [Oscillospiraceae bacterium]|nr:TIGR00282 family metallophosphoesterase [Oscillospiraceae bacterium]